MIDEQSLKRFCDEQRLKRFYERSYLGRSLPDWVGDIVVLWDRAQHDYNERFQREQREKEKALHG